MRKLFFTAAIFGVMLVVAALWLNQGISEKRALLTEVGKRIQLLCETAGACPEHPEGWEADGDNYSLLSDGSALVYSVHTANFERDSFEIRTAVAADITLMARGGVGKPVQLWTAGEGPAPDRRLQ